MLFSNLARLVDHAVREYAAARRLFLAYVDSKAGEKLGLIFQIQSHLETCVHALFRACRFAKALRERSASPPIDNGELLSEQQVERLRKFRNAQEHLEERILNGQFRPGAARTVWVRDDEVRVTDKVISYAEISDWIAKLHQLAMRMAETREP